MTYTTAFNVWIGIVLLATSVSMAAADTVRVSNDHDSGPGSFRQALAQADTDVGINAIRFDRNYTVNLRSPLVFHGSQALTIEGEQAVVDGGDIQQGDILTIHSAAPIVLKNIDFRNSYANGVVVKVPAEAVGTVSVTLDKVVIKKTALFGLHIDDNFHEKDEGDAGSAAGILLNISGSAFIDNGVGELDYDGIRVDERGPGDIVAHISDTRINHNGGDGLELDEGGVGDVIVTMINSHLHENGFFNQADLDDGLDIDEAGSGDVKLTLIGVLADGNHEQGLDLGERDAGTIELAFFDVSADHNVKEGIKVFEDGDGDILTFFNHVKVPDAGPAGIRIAQSGDGRVFSERHDVVTSNDGASVARVADEGTGKLLLAWLKR